MAGEKEMPITNLRLKQRKITTKIKADYKKEQNSDINN